MTTTTFTYNTIEDIKNVVQQKFDAATKVSKNDYRYFYGTSVNETGCLIGCLLPIDLANNLDEYHANDTISALYNSYCGCKHNVIHTEKDNILIELFEKHLNIKENGNNEFGISIEFLNKLQRIHDSERDIDVVKTNLKAFLNM